MQENEKRKPGRPRKAVEERAEPTQTFSIRLTNDLRQRVEEAADRSGRPMTGEIVYRLQQSFEPSLETVLLTARTREHDEIQMRIAVLDSQNEDLAADVQEAEESAKAEIQERGRWAREVMEQNNKQIETLYDDLERIRADIRFYGERVASFIEDVKARQERWGKDKS
jgi:vacuolar-type H+-ATPase subunit I/STV1